MKKRFNILLFFLIVLQSNFVNALPKDYWKQNETGYNTSTIHTPSLFSGVSDGVIQEVTAYPQLVRVCC